MAKVNVSGDVDQFLRSAHQNDMVDNISDGLRRWVALNSHECLNLPPITAFEKTTVSSGDMTAVALNGEFVYSVAHGLPSPQICTLTFGLTGGAGVGLPSTANREQRLGRSFIVRRSENEAKRVQAYNYLPASVHTSSGEEIGASGFPGFREFGFIGPILADDLKSQYQYSAIEGNFSYFGNLFGYCTGSQLTRLTGIWVDDTNVNFRLKKVATGTTWGMTSFQLRKLF